MFTKTGERKQTRDNKDHLDGTWSCALNTFLQKFNK